MKINFHFFLICNYNMDFTVMSQFLLGSVDISLTQLT